MIHFLFQGYYIAFFLILFALILSLSFHEFGHAITAYKFGDDTAKRAGRLTINPIAHIDPVGLLMVIFIGIGFAKPVPVDPRKFNSFWGELCVAAAGPAMNFLVAFVSVNFYYYGLAHDWQFITMPLAEAFFGTIAWVNILLMVFNLLPIGALDGHYILPYLLPKKLARTYYYYNEKYGNLLLLGLLLAYFAGIPILQYLAHFGQILLQLIIIV